MINQHDIGHMLAVRRVHWTPEKMRHAYLWTLEAWASLGITPDKIGGSGECLPKANKYGSFSRFRKRLQTYDFEDASHLSMETLGKEGKSEMSEWVASTVLNRLPTKDEAHFGLNPHALDITSERAVSVLTSAANQVGGVYGYIFSQEMRYCPGLYSRGVGFGNIMNERKDDHGMNISWWGRTGSDEDWSYEAGLLRDIYPHNFLSTPYLDAPVGGTLVSLREWIEADADRGTLEPFTGALWLWRPVVEHIPAIREALYRAGRVYYWRFFDPSDPLYRPNLHEPWVAEGETPEVYQAEFYKDKDPGLIY